ncbi:uncharacterized protein LOC122497676 [Leptopilina heterotoma]|uniref:uncharacterized protein LOC122497676 n=1 Tax=Leptopilina heterotoma TaxID=63436 RepID=UPI001CA8BB91|nr:uncharacterized protein LOC122497676 [Leptopilina heterotoma]
MSRFLRKRLPLLIENSEEKMEKHKSSNPADLKKNSRVGASKQCAKVKTTRTSKRTQEQDENIVPESKNSQETEKIKASNRLLNLKTQILKPDAKTKKAALHVKSPVFRDRTNESVDPTKVDSPLNVIIPMAKRSATKTKLQNEVSSDGKLPSRTKLRSENSPQKELSHNKLEQKETGATAERVIRTRSGKLSTGKNNGTDERKKKSAKENENIKDNIVEEDKEDVPKKETKTDTAPKQRKFFTLSVKERARKKNLIKKPVLDESSFSVPVIPEEITPSKKKTLRPRQDVKNYCEKSKLASSPSKRNSKTAEKIPSPTAKKVPIWNTIKFSEAKAENKDVYEISDSDLSFEGNPKKRKKAIKKKPPKRLKKTVKFSRPIKSKLPKSVGVQKMDIQMPKVEIGEQLISQVQINPSSSSQAQPSPQVHQKPKLVSVEVLDNKNKLTLVPSASVPQPAKEFRPFRVTQNFRALSIMQPNMADHSLLSRTLSPIAKVAENVDFSTPWRLPQAGKFSRVCNLIQSTPQIKNGGSLLSRKTVLDTAEEKKTDDDKSTSAVEMGSGRHAEDNADADSTPVNLKADESKMYDIPHVPSPDNASVQNSFSNDVEDKENAAPNLQSPRNSPKKTSVMGTPTFEPQPGPSGLQKQPLRELKVLRQTNLNDFLSLDDAPERTEIKTPHGIFDDVHSTPINSKFVKKTPQTDIENAFGFDDDVDVSSITCPIEKPVNTVPKGILREKRGNIRTRQESQHKKPVRFSAKEVLRTLHTRRVKKEENNVKEKQVNEGKDKREENVIEEPAKEAAKMDQENEVMTTTAPDFSDTFDFLKEQTKENDVNDQNSSVLPLFADLEPTHFATPPKSTYKRKRNMKYSFSDVSDEDENRNEVKEKITKKTKKLKKEDKKLNDWAKSINKTFEEIDNFDLIVE